MLWQRARLAFFAIEVLAVSSLLDGVVVPEEASGTQFWKKELDDVLERAGFHGVGLGHGMLESLRHQMLFKEPYEVETIYVSFVNPSLDFVRHLSARADSSRS